MLNFVMNGRSGFQCILTISNLICQYSLQKRFLSIFVKKLCHFQILEALKIIQARIAQLVAYWLGSGGVPGSNHGKGKNFSMNISILQVPFTS